jgi:hypothetical protein
MIFPSDSEIREFASYYIRAVKIFKEEFKNSVGREPSEFEITDFCKMGIIPFGILKQNGFQKQPQDHASLSQSNTPNKENTNLPAQSKNQLMQSKQKPIDSIMDIVKGHPEIEIDGDKVILKKKLDMKIFFDIKDELVKRGWRYISPRYVGKNWEPGYFEMLV